MADGSAPVASNYDVIRAKSDAEEKALMLIGKMNARDYFDLRDRRWLHRRILERWIIQNYYDPSQLAVELESISSYYKGEYVVPWEDGRFVFTDPYQDEEFVEGLRRRMDFQRSERMRVLEGSLQESVRTTNMVDIEKTFSDYSDSFYMRRLTGGKFYIISGDLGYGKSDLGCTFSDMAIRSEGRLVLSGIELMSDYEGYVYCRTFTRLFYEACKAKVEGRKILLIIDEGGLEYPSYRATATPMQILDRLSKLFRKLGLDWIFISQRETQVPTSIKMYNAIWFMKPEKTKVEMVVNDGRPSRKELITDVPRTKLPFNSDHISSLSADITVEEILRFLETLPERTNQFVALRDYMAAYIEFMKRFGSSPDGADPRRWIENFKGDIPTEKKMTGSSRKEDNVYGEPKGSEEGEIEEDDAGNRRPDADEPGNI